MGIDILKTDDPEESVKMEELLETVKKEGLPVVKQRVQNLFKKALYNDKQALRELLVIMDFRARPAVAKTLRNMGIYDEGYLQAAMTEGYIEFTKLWVRGSFIKFKEYEDIYNLCIKVYVNKAKKEAEKKNKQRGIAKRDDNREEVSFEDIIWELEDGKTIPDEYLINSPENTYMKTGKTEELINILQLFMEKFFDYKKLPQQVITLGYATILSHMKRDENKDVSIAWAKKQMNERTLKELSKEFEQVYNKEYGKRKSYRWGEKFNQKMENAYKRGKIDKEHLKDLELPGDFSDQELSNWANYAREDIIMRMMPELMQKKELVDMSECYFIRKWQRNVSKSKAVKEGVYGAY